MYEKKYTINGMLWNFGQLLRGTTVVVLKEPFGALT